MGPSAVSLLEINRTAYLLVFLDVSVAYWRTALLWDDKWELCWSAGLRCSLPGKTAVPSNHHTSQPHAIQPTIQHPSASAAHAPSVTCCHPSVIAVSSLLAPQSALLMGLCDPEAATSSP